MKAYIIILISLLAITFLWKFMILAGIIWLVLRFVMKEYLKYKEEAGRVETQRYGH